MNLFGLLKSRGPTLLSTLYFGRIAKLTCVRNSETLTYAVTYQLSDLLIYHPGTDSTVVASWVVLFPPQDVSADHDPFG
jgi:hypothetical protein